MGSVERLRRKSRLRSQASHDHPRCRLALTGTARREASHSRVLLLVRRLLRRLRLAVVLPFSLPCRCFRLFWRVLRFHLGHMTCLLPRSSL